MPVFALWSAPRARSTAFFRSMLERGDLLALHEPLEGLMYLGDTEVEGRTFDTPLSLLAWLREETHDVSVFLKETTDYRVREAVLADRRFLAEARHAFLIRRPDEIAASLYAVIASIKEQDSLYPDMRVESIGLEALHELHAAVHDAGGHRPVVIDSDDLAARPEATMAAYCAVVELPFIPQALTWEPGERPEWGRSARWHADVSVSSGFEQREGRYAHTVETSDELARFAAHHLPFYEQLHAHRLDVAAWEPMWGS
jgi:Sulfotransferase domain